MPIVGKNGLVFRATSVFLAVVPVFVVTRAAAGFGLPKGTAKLLAQAPITIGVVPSLRMARHTSQMGLPTRSFFGSFVLHLIKRGHRIHVIDFLNEVVNISGIVAPISQNVTLLKR